MNKSALNKDEQSAPIIYVALGDSTGVGVGAQRGGGYVARLFTRIKRVDEEARAVNLCVSGATTADVLREQAPRLANLDPTLITLGIGINDLGRGVTVEQFARNYEAIIRGLKQKPRAAIVVVNIPDISLAPRVPVYAHDEARRRINLFNQRIEESASKQNLHLVDIYGPSSELIPKHPEFFSADGFHPSEAGYEYWAKHMWPIVEQAIKNQ